MRRWRTLGQVITLALLVSAGPAVAETAREILDRVRVLDDTTRKWTDRTQRMTLLIYDKRGGERRRVLKVYDKRYAGDENKAISFFESPPEVEGTAFLQWAHKQRDDDQWLYLPEFKRTRRITARVRDQSFMGTDFSYRDLEILGEIQDWTEEEAPTSLVGADQVDGHDCHVIELRPRQDGMNYGRIVVWIDTALLVTRKMNFERTDARPWKELGLSEIRDVGAVPTAHRLEMRDVEKGSRTVVELTDVAYDTGLPDDLFTERHLERGGL
jgi:outer membrane lipoprotein-sorting protein